MNEIAFRTRRAAARRPEQALLFTAPITTTFGAVLEAFIREHEYCGELDTGLEDERVWMTCTWGAVLVRPMAFGLDSPAACG